MAEALCPAARKNEHFESTQVVLKLKDTQEHKRTPTCAKVAISREGLRSKGLCGFRRTRSVFDRYAIVSEQQLIEGMRKLQKFQDAAEPARQPAPVEARVSTARSAFVN
jgi:hypothetical protein